MSERERRTSTGGTGDNVKDDLDKASGEGATEGAVEKEEQTGGSTGGIKDNVDNDQEKSQERT